MQAESPVREDIIELKKDICTFKQEMMVCTYYAECNLFEHYKTIVPYINIHAGRESSERRHHRIEGRYS